VEHFEDNLSKFIVNENIDDDKRLLLLQDALRRVDKYKPYRARPVNMSVIDHKKETSPQDSFATAGTQLKKEESDSIVSSIGNLMPHSYREQSKRLITYLMESGQDHIQVDRNCKGIIIQGKSYNLFVLIYDMVTNRKGLLSFDRSIQLSKYIKLPQKPY
jgi:hypothetical protein